MTKVTTGGPSSFECGNIHDTDESPGREDRPRNTHTNWHNLDHNSHEVTTGEELSPKPVQNEDREPIAPIGVTGNSIFALQRMEQQNQMLAAQVQETYQMVNRIETEANEEKE